MPRYVKGDYIFWLVEPQASHKYKVVACHKDHQGCGCPQYGVGDTIEDAVAMAIRHVDSFLGALKKLEAGGFAPMDISGTPL